MSNFVKNGNTDNISWRYTYTENFGDDNERWNTALFSSFNDVRNFGTDVLYRNMGNEKFVGYAERMGVVNMFDFYDDSISENSIRQ